MEKRIQNASLLLDASLGHCFQDGLEHRDTNVIFNCLRAYATIDNTRRAEEIFRSTTVAQLIQKIIPHSLLRVVSVGASRDELEEDHKQIKQYIEKDYKFLLEISSTMEESKFVFEAKTIQIIELLVLSTLQWKMNPVTPLSFVDHIVRRFGFKTDLYLEFLWRCERLLLSAITDSRFGCYLPSILVTATMLHVIKEVEPSNVLDCQNELMDIIKISKLHDENQIGNGGSNLDNAKCKLLNWDGTKVVVAEGTIVSTNSKQLIHHVPLGPRCWKAWVNHVKVNVPFV